MHTDSLMTDLRKCLERMCDTNTAAAALQEAVFFKQKRGDFAGELARRMATDHATSPASWWSMFGNDTPTLSTPCNEASHPMCLIKWM